VSITQLVRVHLAEFSRLERSKKLKLARDQQEVTQLVQPVDNPPPKGLAELISSRSAANFPTGPIA
jgi:hypothetical protein